MCTMAPLGGCFAHSSMVDVQGRDVMLSDVLVGDHVLASAADGAATTSRYTQIERETHKRREKASERERER